jgi:hypothetical protein
LKVIILLVFLINLSLFANESKAKNVDKKISKEYAIFLAEKFIKEQGYTTFKISLDSDIQYEFLQQGKNKKDIIENYRYNTLQPKVVGTLELKDEYFVGFYYSEEIYNKSSSNRDYVRVVSVNLNGDKIYLHHKDFKLATLEKIVKTNFNETNLTHKNFDRIIDEILQNGNYFKRGYYYHKISNILLQLYIAHDSSRIILDLKTADDDKTWYDNFGSYLSINKSNLLISDNLYECSIQKATFDKESNKWIYSPATLNKEIYYAQYDDYSKADDWFGDIIETIVPSL